MNWVSESNFHGYILETDLKHPDGLHGLLDDFPVAPGTLEIVYNTLPEYCSNTVDQYGTKVGGVNVSSWCILFLIRCSIVLIFE